MLGVIEISYDEFKSLSDKFDQEKATQFIKNFLDGKLVVVKKAFSENFVNEIKIKVKKYWIETPKHSTK